MTHLRKSQTLERTFVTWLAQLLNVTNKGEPSSLLRACRELLFSPAAIAKKVKKIDRNIERMRKREKRISIVWNVASKRRRPNWCYSAPSKKFLVRAGSTLLAEGIAASTTKRNNSTPVESRQSPLSTTFLSGCWTLKRQCRRGKPRKGSL